jgi:hypothetical protein
MWGNVESLKANIRDMRDEHALAINVREEDCRILREKVEELGRGSGIDMEQLKQNLENKIQDFVEQQKRAFADADAALAKAKSEGLERSNVLSEQITASIEAVAPDGYSWQSTDTAYSQRDARSGRGL